MYKLPRSEDPAIPTKFKYLPEPFVQLSPELDENQTSPP